MGCCYSLAFNIAFKNDYTDVVYSNLKKQSDGIPSKRFISELTKRSIQLGE